MNNSTRPVLYLFVATLLGCGGRLEETPPRALRLATTTSTRDSGLLEQLTGPFASKHQVRVDVIAAGTGKALKLGAVGDVDVVLVHAREAEDAFMAAGHGARREDVMANTFELLGPPTDPAEVSGLEAPAALHRIAAGRFRFVSRGDESGTHQREQALWQLGGGKPNWSEYHESGQGMGATLVVADQLSAYVLSDSGTYLSFQDRIDLVPLAAHSDALHNPYGAIVVTPDRHSAHRGALANAFVDYLISAEAQQIISDYRLAGKPLFLPLRQTPTR